MSEEKRILDRCLRMAPDALERRTGKRLAPRPAIAELAGVSRRAAYKWTRIPAERCIELEEAFGGSVTRYQMRPDVFGKAPQGAA